LTFDLHLTCVQISSSCFNYMLICIQISPFLSISLTFDIFDKFPQFHFFYISGRISLSIIWFINLLIMSVPGDGYSRNASCALNLISTAFFCHREAHWSRVFTDLRILMTTLVYSNSSHEIFAKNKRLRDDHNFTAVFYVYWKIKYPASMSFPMTKKRRRYQI
jgi:hypothetical protein